MTSTPTRFYVTGGTMPSDAPSYIKRQTDNELYQALQQGEYCSILDSSQMGKSSLVIRVMERLKQEGIKVVYFSLQPFGTTDVTLDNWYGSLLTEIDTQLELPTTALSFWDKQRQQNLTPTYCWDQVVRQIILGQCSQPIVFFLDEIGIVQQLPAFTDDFLLSLREFYNSRTTHPEFRRLTFCLIGTATPASLIKDRHLPPFNVGKRIVLADFTETEVTSSLADGLQHKATAALTLLQRVWYWTHGHPYLTQKLCAEVAADTAVTTSAEVDKVCQTLFLASRRNKEANLAQVEDLVKHDPDVPGLLELYRQIRKQQVPDDDTQEKINALRLTGIITVRDNALWVRNPIYLEVFDNAWVEATLPEAEKRRQEKARRRGFWQATGIATVVIAIMAGLAGWAWLAQQRAVKNEQIAEQQRNIAVKQKALALQAVNTLTYELIDQLLAIPRTKEIVLSIFETNVQTLEAIAKLNPDTREAQREKATNLERIGNVWMVLGDTQKALAAYQQMNDIFKRLAAADPSNTQAQRDVSVSYNKIGDVQLRLGQTTDALAAYQQSLEILKRLAAADPTNTQAQRDVSVSYENIGDVQLRLGQTTDALAAYQQTNDILKRLAAADPTNTEAQRDVSVSYDRIGDVQLRLGQTTDAVAAYQQYLEISKRLAAADPTNTEAQRDVSVSYETIGDVQLRLGQTTDALAAYQQSLDIRQRLAAADPTNTQAQRDVSISYEKIGDVQLRLGQTTDALAAYQQDLEIRKRLAAADPTNTEAQRDVSVSYDRIGDVQLRLGQTTDALAAYQQTNDILKRLAAADPTNTEAQQEVMASYQRLGDIQLHLGNTNELRQTYQKLLEIGQRLAAADPTNTEAQRNVSVSYNKLGRIQEALENAATALETQRQGLVIAQKLAKHDEKNADVQNMRLEFEGVIKRLEGDEQVRLTNLETALQAYQQALVFSTQVAKNQLDNLDARNDVILNNERIGWTLYQQKQYEQALDYLHQAQEASPPAVPKYIAIRLATHLGEVLWTMGKTEEAKQVWEKALQQFPEDEKLRAVVKRLQGE